MLCNCSTSTWKNSFCSVFSGDKMAKDLTRDSIDVTIQLYWGCNMYSAAYSKWGREMRFWQISLSLRWGEHRKGWRKMAFKVTPPIVISLAGTFSKLFSSWIFKMFLRERTSHFNMSIWNVTFCFSVVFKEHPISCYLGEFLYSYGLPFSPSLSLHINPHHKVSTSVTF